MKVKLISRRHHSSGDLKKLLAVVARLRSAQGCPWDRAQTHASLARYLLEESHEAYDLLERGASDAELVNELGDVLLQVILHARIGQERGAFDFGRICQQLRQKMIERHSHVFGKDKRETPEEVEASWEARKSSPRPGGRLAGIPKTLPALIRAERIQDRAAAMGFDWENISGVVEKVREEAMELAQAKQQGDSDKIFDELGDLLFSIVNLARYLCMSPERALHQTIEKFAFRFSYMEEKAKALGRELSSYSLAEQDEFWNLAKADE